MEENQKIDIERERGRERIPFYLAGWILTGLGAVLLLLHHFTGLSVQTYLPACSRWPPEAIVRAAGEPGPRRCF